MEKAKTEKEITYPGCHWFFRAAAEVNKNNEVTSARRIWDTENGETGTDRLSVIEVPNNPRMEITRFAEKLEKKYGWHEIAISQPCQATPPGGNSSEVPVTHFFGVVAEWKDPSKDNGNGNSP